MGAFTFADAQTTKPLHTYMQTLPLQKVQDYTPASPVIATNKKATTTPTNYFGKTTVPPVKVGQTENDRQANSSIYRRIITYPGNKISIAWMTSSDGPTNGYLSRGTGYNSFDGSSWGSVSEARIEQNRAGYPCLDYSSTLNKEIVFSHRIDTNSKSGGLIFSQNLSVGSSSWAGQIVLDTPSVTTHSSILWPRSATSGNYIHVLGNYSVPSASQPDSVIISGVRQPTVYSRYNTATSTWEVKNITLPGYNGTRWYAGQGDGYSIDAVGNTVAILMGSYYNDLTLWKSGDNGHTWTQTIIDSFPFPAYNSTQPFPGTHLNDTITTCDGTINVKLDQSGKAHCFWGRMKIAWNQTGSTPGVGFFLGNNNAIDYWYEGRPTIITGQIGFAPDTAGTPNIQLLGAIDAHSRYGVSGLATMPYASTDTAGNIFLVYSGLAVGDDDGNNAFFRDIFCVYSSNGGVTWSAPLNLTKQFGLNVEQMFASTAQNITNKLHITYMQSNFVGFYGSGSNGNNNKAGPFDIMYWSIPTADIMNGKVGINEVQNELFTLDQNYPNPFNGTTTVPVTLKKTTDVKINVINIVGQTVYSQNFDKAQAGINKFSIDLTHLNSGVYFYTVEAEGYKVTKRMIVE